LLYFNTFRFVASVAAAHHRQKIAGASAGASKFP
jgi:hypothetical protein